MDAECLWRLIGNGQIFCTNLDDGHVFGLPAAIDAALEVNRRLAGEVASAVNLREGTLDLEICIGTVQAIQLIPKSAGYESWQVSGPPGRFIAVGGGKLEIFRRPIDL